VKITHPLAHVLVLLLDFLVFLLKHLVDIQSLGMLRHLKSGSFEHEFECFEFLFEDFLLLLQLIRFEIVFALVQAEVDEPI
jgi:hypothetical protein